MNIKIKQSNLPDGVDLEVKHNLILEVRNCYYND